MPCSNWQSWSLNLTENALELQRTDVLYWKINLCTFCCPPFSTVILSPTMPLPLYPWTAISASCPSPSNIMPIGVLLSPDVSSLLVSLFLIPRILSEAWIIVTKRNMLKHLINLMVLCKFCTILVMFLQKKLFCEDNQFKQIHVFCIQACVMNMQLHTIKFH